MRTSPSQSKLAWT